MREAHTELSKIYTRNWIDIKSGIVSSDSQNYILSLRSIKKTKMFFMTLEQTSLLVPLCFLSTQSNGVQKIEIYFVDEITVR